MVYRAGGTVITYTTTDTELIAELGSGRVIHCRTDLDVEELFAVLDAVGEIEETGDALSMLTAFRKILPAGFVDQTRGVPAADVLPIVLRWVGVLGANLGKAFTSVDVTDIGVQSSLIG